MANALQPKPRKRMARKRVAKGKMTTKATQSIKRRSGSMAAAKGTIDFAKSISKDMTKTLASEKKANTPTNIVKADKEATSVLARLRRAMTGKSAKRVAIASAIVACVLMAYFQSSSIVAVLRMVRDKGIEQGYFTRGQAATFVKFGRSIPGQLSKLAKNASDKVMGSVSTAGQRLAAAYDSLKATLTSALTPTYRPWDPEWQAKEGPYAFKTYENELKYSLAPTKKAARELGNQSLGIRDRYFKYVKNQSREKMRSLLLNERNNQQKLKEYLWQTKL